MSFSSPDPPRLGIALGSGSARGWAHVGVLQGLAEAGIHPDVVCGSSVGAFVGAAFVTGNLDALDSWGRGLSARDVVRLLDVTFRSGGVLAGERMMEFLGQRGNGDRIEELSRPFAAVATDLASGREIWMRSGPVVEAVRASLALPGVLTPIAIGHRWLADGGLVNPLPTSLCRALGADLVIAVNLNAGLLSGASDGEDASVDEFLEPADAGDGEGAGGEWPSDSGGRLPMRLLHLAGHARRKGERGPSMVDVMTRSIHIMQDRVTRSRMAGDPPEILLAPRLTGIRLLDFDKASSGIEVGRQCVRANLPAIETTLGRLGYRTG